MNVNPYDKRMKKDDKKAFAATKKTVKPVAKDTNKTRRKMVKPTARGRQFFMEARKDCKYCKGTGLLEVESLTIGPGKFKNGKIIYETFGHDDWHQAQCYCVGEDDAT